MAAYKTMLAYLRKTDFDRVHRLMQLYEWDNFQDVIRGSMEQAEKIAPPPKRVSAVPPQDRLSAVAGERLRRG